MRKQTKCEGHCPFCDSTDIEIEEDGLEDGYYYYYFRCCECDKTFTEWYSLHYKETEYDVITQEEEEEQKLRKQADIKNHNEYNISKIKTLIEANEDNLSNNMLIMINEKLQNTDSAFYDPDGRINYWRTEHYIKEHVLSGSLKPTPEQLDYFVRTGYKSWQY